MKGSRRNFNPLCAVCLSLSLLVPSVFLPVKADADAVYEETEDNNTFDTANTLPANQPVQGVMGTEGENADESLDRDYYRFTMPGTGYVSFTLSFNTPEELILDPHITVYTKNEKEYYDYQFSDSDGNAASTVKFTPKKGEVYYVCVWHDYTYGAGLDYTLTADYTEADDYEVEPNDNIKAVKDQKFLKKGMTINGIMQKERDRDYFKYKLNKKGKIRITFTLNEQADQPYVLTVFKKSGAKVKEVSEIIDGTEFSTKKLKKGTYYICIEPEYDWDSVSKEYMLTVN